MAKTKRMKRMKRMKGGSTKKKMSKMNKRSKRSKRVMRGGFSWGHVAPWLGVAASVIIGLGVAAQIYQGSAEPDISADEDQTMVSFRISAKGSQKVPHGKDGESYVISVKASGTCLDIKNQVKLDFNKPDNVVHILDGSKILGDDYPVESIPKKYWFSGRYQPILEVVFLPPLRVTYQRNKPLMGD